MHTHHDIVFPFSQLTLTLTQKQYTLTSLCQLDRYLEQHATKYTFESVAQYKHVSLPPTSSLANRMQKTPNQGSGNPQESQRLQAEIQALKQRLQETGARGDNELEQWRKVVEQEKNRADQAEKAANEMHKHVQVQNISFRARM